MRALIQRVSKAEVQVKGNTVGKIGKGLLVFLGIGEHDNQDTIEPLVDKIINLRIYESDGKPMNLSIKDINGQLLIVSQFTLYGSLKKGRRPDFTSAAKPDKAKKLYEKFVETCKASGLKTETGEFAAMMDVSLVNDGPVTFLLDSNDLIT